jgi:hypothetical protein
MTPGRLFLSTRYNGKETKKARPPLQPGLRL